MTASTSTITGDMSTAITDGGESTFSWTKKIHTQQPDGSWNLGQHLLSLPTPWLYPTSHILARMQEELRREVLDFSQKEATRDLGRVRIAQGRARGHDGIRPRFVQSAPGALG